MSVGILSLLVNDKIENISFPALVFYPSDMVSKETKFGPYILDVASDSTIRSGSFPLVIISHGNGSSPLAYRTLAFGLAQAGFIVAVPEHFGNNRNENHLEGTTENLELRPRHIINTINCIYADERFQKVLQLDQVAVIGHSMGGYTALAVAGGNPWIGIHQKIEIKSDSRIKALVLFAPATAWFGPRHSLDKISASILMYTAEHDTVTTAWQGQLIEDYLPKQLIHHKIKNAGHFSFLSPFPEEMKKLAFPPSTDPAGFDRVEFHKRLNSEVIAFLNQEFRRGSH
jgi:predicted dienelactone hydrolase